LLLFVLHATARAEYNPAPVTGEDPPVIQVLDGSKGQLKVDSVTMVEDAKFYNGAYTGLLKNAYPVKNMVSLEINEEANVPIPVYFETWVKVEIKYWDANDNITTEVDTLYIRYDTSTTYRNSHNHVFQGGFRVQVKVLDIKPGTSNEVLNALKIVNQLQSSPEYNLTCANLAVEAIHDSAWAPNTLNDELPVYWAPAIGADEYDLEWAYIDDSTLASGIYGNPALPSLIFDNNATRVTISGTYYKIPLIYDNSGHLFFRVRPVQWLANGMRTEAVWSSNFSNGLGDFKFNGHERTLNWQATTTFAEDGKRKTVVQYFDGSLRTRQTVTKDNSTEKTIVAETIYDYQGRPVIQVMPAPTLSSVIGYSQNFNRGLNSGEAYDKSLFDTLVSADAYCNTNAPAMDTLSGAANYYSGANPLAQTGYHKYIPDAKGFPFTEVEYTQDNTGRISRQGGVGENFRIGSGHETKYMYGTADQRELDALFGTEAGYAQHYFKTSVRDANGQYSISYTDMHGRTVATALAGVPPDSIKLDTLSSYYSAMRTEKLSDPTSTVIKDWVMESKKSLLVTKEGNHTFTYELNPQTLLQDGCRQANICYECLYNLQITITDDCNNQKLPGGVAFDTVVRNFQIGAIDTCGNGGFSFSFNKWLVEGSYEVTKKLSVSRYALDYYRDSVYMKNNTCKTIDSFIREQRELLAGVMECRPTCESCTDSLGTWEQFRERYRLRAGLTEQEMAEFESMALTSYNQAREDCNELCGTSASDYNDIRRNMLMDMTPSSGQYANIDNAGDALSIFYYYVDNGDTVKPKYQDVTGYRDENGNIEMVYDEVVGKMVPPQNLSAEVFAQKFKLSWAEALLPLHPEYCKLQRYEQLKSSHEWDRRFDETDTYAEALAKGYLNPTRQLNAPSSIGTGGTDIADPLMAQYSTALTNALSNYRTLSGGAVSMWSVATISAMCKEGSNSETCFQNYDNVNEAFNPAAMCEAEMDMAWRAFRQMYLDVKRGLINKQWLTGGNCGNTLSATALMARGFSPNFGDAEELNKAHNSELPQNTAQAQSEIQGQITDYYVANCDAYINQWIQQLSGCPQYPADSIRNVIVPRLIQVCREGSDQSHPYGASSVKPSSNFIFRSFEEVIQHYNQTHGITDKAKCNVYKITAPKPYNQQAAFGNKPIYSKPDECECDLIASYYNKYQNATGYSSFSDYMRKVYNTIISDSALNLLLGFCEVPGAPEVNCSYVSSPIFMPPAFQCYSGDVCINCEQFAAADSAFRAQFPGMVISDSAVTDSAQLSRNKLYEDFMNYRFGFANRLDEYLAFARKCGLDPVKRQLEQIQNNYNDSRQQVAGVRVKFTAANGQVFYWDDIVEDGSIRLPEPIRSQPTNWYNNVEFTTLGNRKWCMQSGFGLEFRMRYLGVDFMGDMLYVNTQNLVCVFQRTPQGITLKSATEPYAPPQSFSPILLNSDPNSVLDWFTVKVRMTTSHCYIYYNGTLVYDFDRNPNGPINVVNNMVIGIFKNKGNVDYIKMFDQNDQLRYFEDFNNFDKPALPDQSWLCPQPGDCLSSFVQYFNQQTGSSYNFSQIAALYNANCVELTACKQHTGMTDTLENIVKNFKVYNNPYSLRFACQANQYPQSSPYHYMRDPNLIVGDGFMRFPDTVRKNDGLGWRYHQILGAELANFCLQNGYSIEWQLTTLKNTIPVGADQIYFTDDNGGFVIYKHATGLHLREVTGRHVNGNTLVISSGSVLLDTDPHAIDNHLTKIKLTVTPTWVRFYYNDRLVSVLPRSNPNLRPLRVSGRFTTAFYTTHGAIDWIKIYDVNNELKCFEDFNSRYIRAIIDPSFLCPTPSPANCETAFRNYFNQQRGTNYTYAQIESLYRNNHVPLDPCRLSETNRNNLNNWLDDYKKYGHKPNFDASGIDTTHWKLNWGGWNYTMKFPFAEAFDNGVLRLPPHYDTAQYVTPGPGIDHVNDTICLDSAGFTFETSVKLPDSDIIPNWYNTAWWFWLYSTSASGDVLVSLGPQNGSGLVAVTDHNRNPIILNEGTPGIHLNDWTNLKLQFRGSQFRIYINDSLWGQTTMHGPMTDMYTWSFTPFSFKGLIDYIKITNFTGEVLYHEEFNDPNNLAIFPDKARCESCQDRFTRYFNARNNSNLNFSEIAALYKSNACVSLNLCDEPAPTLCGRAEPLFPPVVLEEINNCSDSSFFIASKAQELHQVYLDSLKGHFDSAYIARCLEAYKHEKFEVRHAVNEFHHTLYYYDQAGNLIKTVPPAGVRANYDSLWLDGVALARDAGTVQVPAHELVTQYRYNTLNQVIASHSPDGGLAEFWYDRLGRLAISRNARQKAASTTENNRQYSYTWYDKLGRIVEVGQVSNTTANGEMTHAISKNATSLGTWLGNLSTRRSQYIATWYDDAPIPPSIEGQIGRRNLRNRVSHTYYADTGNFSLYAAAIYYTYDILGNVDTILQDYGNSSGASVQNMMNVNNNRFKKIAYNYDLVSGKVNRVTYQPGRTDQWIHRYTYDAENRLTLVETSTDDMVWEKDARYEYYRHGPLARMTLGHQQVQAIDYAYTLQGWLKGINSTGGTAGHDMGEDGLSGSEHQYTARDAMGLTLNYFAGDYSSIGRRNPFPGYSGHMPSGAYRPLFNGNISSASVYQKKFEGANPLIFYNYKYDQLNRLTGQDAFNGFDTANNNWDALALMTGKLTERISYDGNGNIQTYERRSLAGGRMDELAYSYYPGTNRLNRVYDQVDASEFTDPVIKDIDAQDTDNYIYDAIGNLIVDRSEKIHIRWNVYGKITQIDSIISFTPTTFQTTPRIFYEYDALGNRIGQASKKGGVWYYTWYVRDAQGNILTTYTAEGGTNLGALNVHQQDRYVYGSSRVGSFSLRKSVDAGPVDLPTNRVDTFARGYREYELTNHLGNVLATISDKKFGVLSDTYSSLIDHYEADIVNATDYYPFGMPSRVSLTGKGYRFGFNGKENDNDVKGWGNQQDYGMRIYDPRVGRFLSVDPISREYPWYTPYQFAGNTPMQAVDIDGLEPGSFHMANSLTKQTDAFQAINKQDKEQATKYLNNATKLNVVAAAAVLDFMTGGKASTFLFMWLPIASLPEHNVPKTEEGKQMERERANENIKTLAGGIAIQKSLSALAQGVKLLFTPKLYRFGNAQLGAMGEEALARQYGTYKPSGKGSTMKTSVGRRVPDGIPTGEMVQTTDKLYEAKVGFQEYTGNIVTQVAKDKELLATGQLKEITWVFYRSPNTGKVGASDDLLRELNAAGIKTEIAGNIPKDIIKSHATQP
jgi:RHS repeat-associated core domain